jgi:16S rRNA processing protein RimM
MSRPSLILLGRIRKPHGIRGEVCLAFEAEDPKLLRGEVYLAPPAGEAPPAAGFVERVRLCRGEVLLTLRGVDNRDKAEELRRQRLFIPRTRLPLPAEGEVYLFSLPGLRVLSRDEGGAETEIGRIASVDTPAGQEIWTILTPEGREILFPAAPDFVLEINPEAGLARIAPPPGLLALYLEK